ncbi:succinate dehydrogenase assembly factor 2 [Segnochrobactraceae bacterium EtOH-i3]
MAGPSRTSADLDPRRARILYRAWHRGMKEMDIILGNFADAHIAGLSDAELDVLEDLMSVPDAEAFTWFSGRIPAPEEYDTPLFHQILTFQTDRAADVTA